MYTQKASIYKVADENTCERDKEKGFDAKDMKEIHVRKRQREGI